MATLLALLLVHQSATAKSKPTKSWSETKCPIQTLSAFHYNPTFGLWCFLHLRWKCVFQPRGRETYSKHLVDPTVQISPLQIAVPRGLQMEIPWYLPVKPLGWENSAWNAALSGKGNVYMLCDSTVRSKADAVTSSWTQLWSSRRVWLLKWAFQGQRHIFKINVIYRNCVLSLMYL